MLQNPTGLHNPHVMCYMNASLQSLFSLQSFTNLLGNESPLWKDLRELYNALERENKPVAPKENALFRAINWGGRWLKIKQEDANDYLMTLLNRLDGISSLFDALFLNIPLNPSLENALSTQSPLRTFFPILWITLNRATITPLGPRKNNTVLTFPEKINFYGRLYQLRSVIYHKGTTESGHYTASCKRGSQWFWLDDSIVISEPSLPPTIRDNATPYMFFYEFIQNA